MPRREVGKLLSGDIPIGYNVQEVAGQFDIYGPGGKFMGTRNMLEDAIKYTQDARDYYEEIAKENHNRCLIGKEVK